MPREAKTGTRELETTRWSKASILRVSVNFEASERGEGDGAGVFVFKLRERELSALSLVLNSLGPFAFGVMVGNGSHCLALCAVGVPMYLVFEGTFSYSRGVFILIYLSMNVVTGHCSGLLLDNP